MLQFGSPDAALLDPLVARATEQMGVTEVPTSPNPRFPIPAATSFFARAESSLVLSPAELGARDRRNALGRVPRLAVGVSVRGDADSDLWAVRGYQTLRNHGASVDSAHDGSLFAHWVVADPFDPTPEADAARLAIVELGIVYRQFGVHPPMRLFVGAHMSQLRRAESVIRGDCLGVAESLSKMAFDHGVVAVASRTLCDLMTEAADPRPVGPAPILDRGVPVQACALRFGPRRAH